MSDQTLHLNEDELQTIITRTVRTVLQEQDQHRTGTEFGSEHLTRDEAAAFLKVSKHRLWQMERESRIRARRVGRRLLYLRSELQTALESGALS